MKKLIIILIGLSGFILQAMDHTKSSQSYSIPKTAEIRHANLPSQNQSSLPVSLRVGATITQSLGSSGKRAMPSSKISMMTISEKEMLDATKDKILTFIKDGDFKGLQEYQMSIAVALAGAHGQPVSVKVAIKEQKEIVEKMIASKDIQALIEISKSSVKDAILLYAQLNGKPTDRAILEAARHIIPQKPGYREFTKDPFAQAAEYAKDKIQKEVHAEAVASSSSSTASTADLVSTFAHPVPNISKEVDARIESAINKLNTIDPKNDIDAFIKASTDILTDLKTQGLLGADKNRSQEILTIFAKAALRRLNPVTQFTDMAKLAYHIAKWALLESGSSMHLTAEGLKNAQPSLERFFETIKAMDPRSLTEDQWAEFLGTVVGDFGFFGGLGKIVHYFTTAPVTIEIIEARPLDYAHSVIQYEQLKTALQIEEFTSIIDVTKHGLQRLLERGFQAKEISDLIRIPDKVVTQSNGLKGFIKKTGEKFNFMVINSEDKKVVTVIRNIDLKKLQSLGRNYGWDL